LRQRLKNYALVCCLFRLPLHCARRRFTPESRRRVLGRCHRNSGHYLRVHTAVRAGA